MRPYGKVSDSGVDAIRKPLAQRDVLGPTDSGEKPYASRHSRVTQSTKFSRDALPIAAVSAHDAFLSEFADEGAAQLHRADSWFILDGEAVARSMETMAIVAILIATFSYTSFISPPGGWLAGGPGSSTSQMGAAALADPKTSTAFQVFVYSNASALTASLALVLIIAVGSAFGWKAQEMLWLLSSSFMLLCLAVMGASVAFAAVAYILSPGNSTMFWVITALSAAAAVLAVVMLTVVVFVVKAKAWNCAYSQRMKTLVSVMAKLLNTLRMLNSSYLSPYANVEEPVLALYFHWYSVATLMTVSPVVLALIGSLQQLKVKKPYTWCMLCTGFMDLDSLMRNKVCLYYAGWCGEVAGRSTVVNSAVITPALQEVRWDVGCSNFTYGLKHVGDGDYVGITGGHAVWSPEGADITGTLGQLGVAADALVAALLEPWPGTAKQQETLQRRVTDACDAYRGYVKSVFLQMNLNVMMPYSIKVAQAP